MVKIIDPKVRVIDYGPNFSIEKDGKIIEISPDEWVYGAAGITYKDIGAVEELLEMKASETDIEEKVRNSLIKSAGAGHASMATTPGLWMLLEGNCSKLVDSLFTGEKFGSYLMPSGRRVPISKDQIVVPRGIADKGQGAVDLYVSNLEKDIDLYEQLHSVEKSVSKQEAAKIVPYGHRGSGFLFMPLETVVGLSRTFESNKEFIPQEGRDILNHLEGFIRSSGMKTTYFARKNAPRTGVPTPDIFHDRVNEAEELRREYLNKDFYEKDVMLIGDYCLPSKLRDDRIEAYLEKRDEIFKSSETISKHWKELLNEAHEIIKDYNNSVSVSTLTNTPWRVWGEVKRHRTLNQTTESVYHAADFAYEFITETEEESERGVVSFSKVLSMPGSVARNRDVFNRWTNRFVESMKAYNSLVEDYGVRKSDAINVVPRGLKLGIVKTFDFYNLTTGYMSLRLCSTAEPEIQKQTNLEQGLLKYTDMSEAMKEMVGPKCAYTGFCPDMNSCGKIVNIAGVKQYNDEMHKGFKAGMAYEIKNDIKGREGWFEDHSSYMAE